MEIQAYQTGSGPEESKRTWVQNLHSSPRASQSPSTSSGPASLDSLVFLSAPLAQLPLKASHIN